MIKNKIKTLLIITIMLFSAINIAFAQAGENPLVSVKLLNQDPDPVKSGDDFEVRFSIKNEGGEAVENYMIEVLPEYPFEIFGDEKAIHEIGTILSYTNEENINIIKFKLIAKTNIEEGTYPLKILTYQKGKRGLSVQREFNIKIDSESNAEISNINIESLIPGEKTNLSFSIKNVGKSRLENLMFKWENENDIILPVGSSNVRYVDSIGVGEEKKIDFSVVSDLNTQPKLYKLDLTLEYDDVENLQKITEAGTIDTQKRRTVQSKAGIYVGGETSFEVSFTEFLRGEASFSITNIGSNLANSVVVKIPTQENWTLQGSDSDVVGSIKKGSFGRAQFKIKPKYNDYGSNNLTLLVEYTDTTGKRQNFTKTLTLDSSFFKENQNVNFSNLEREKNNSFFNWRTAIVIIVLLIGGFIFYKKKKSKKKMKLNNI